MPPLRNLPAAKPPPAKTERSHEENQERAYIAASRRSDRSLEARVESARRASEIHEKRTGRRLRVTEQDVINEEMYEEEDDNIPWRYRHLSMMPNLASLPPDLKRRVEAQLAFEMERSRMVDPTGRFGQGSQFMNPGMMSMPLGGQQSMFSPSMYSMAQPSTTMSPQSAMFPPPSPSMAQQQARAGTPGQHRQSPYLRPGQQARSASIADPQELSMHTQQQSHSAQSPQTSSSLSDRRMSLPTNRNSQSPNPSKAAKITHTGSSQRSPTDSSMHAQPHFSQPYSFADSNPYAPLTSTLPLNTQQLLGGDGMFGFMGDFNSPPLKHNSFGMDPPMYNYNPNASLKSTNKRSHDQITTTTGLEQTLMPTASALHGQQGGASGFYDSPISPDQSMLNTSSAIDSGFDGSGFYDDNFQLDAFNSSGQGSPAADFSNFTNDELYRDSSFAF